MFCLDTFLVACVQHCRPTSQKRDGGRARARVSGDGVKQNRKFSAFSLGRFFPSRPPVPFSRAATGLAWRSRDFHFRGGVGVLRVREPKQPDKTNAYRVTGLPARPPTIIRRRRYRRVTQRARIVRTSRTPTAADGLIGRYKWCSPAADADAADDKTWTRDWNAATAQWSVGTRTVHTTTGRTRTRDHELRPLLLLPAPSGRAPRPRWVFCDAVTNYGAQGVDRGKRTAFASTFKGWPVVVPSFAGSRSKTVLKARRHNVVANGSNPGPVSAGPASASPGPATKQSSVDYTVIIFLRGIYFRLDF